MKTFTYDTNEFKSDQIKTSQTAAQNFQLGIWDNQAIQAIIILKPINRKNQKEEESIQTINFSTNNLVTLGSAKFSTCPKPTKKN